MMHIITQEDIEKILTDMRERCRRARAMGGIALQDVVNGTTVVPPGWNFDPHTDYFVPRPLDHRLN